MEAINSLSQLLNATFIARKQLYRHEKLDEAVFQNR